MKQRFLVVALAVFLIGTLADRAAAEQRVERNVVFGMYSGLALLMDVYHPENPNGYGIVFISGSGWTRELGLDATPLKESGQEDIYAVPLAAAGLHGVRDQPPRLSPLPSSRAPGGRAARSAVRVRHHAAAYGIDPDRIGAMGGSSGGHLASLLGVLDGKGAAEDAGPVNRESAKVQAVVARAAPTDLTLASPRSVHPLFGFRRSERKGSVEYQRFVAASPVTHVTADDPPVLLIHGDADEGRAVQERRGHAGGAGEGRRAGRPVAGARRGTRSDVSGSGEPARLHRRHDRVVRPLSAGATAGAGATVGRGGSVAAPLSTG